ncbi:MAG: ATP-binding cassette domain-containing protein [Deltaproteobacteria bacterium]|nr:ATP-binding cassette domain-containing protein [Deltaproteobacteria bacterium]
MKSDIFIEGANENNLKNISVSIPHDSICLVCGRSGSGKTTLAVDIIHNESQREYFQTFSTYARQFVEKIAIPTVLRVKNLRASVCVLQSRSVRNSKATVGSAMHITDNLKILFKNFSTAICPKCKTKVKSMEPHSVQEDVFKKIGKSQSFLVCGIVRNISNQHVLKTRLLDYGFSRVWVDGTIRFLEDLNVFPEPSFIVVERFGVHKQPEYVLRAIETAYHYFENECAIVLNSNVLVYRRDTTCSCGFLDNSHRISNFDASSSAAACKICKGFGYRLYYDPVKILNLSKSPLDGGIVPFNYSIFKSLKRKFEKAMSSRGISLNRAIAEFSDSDLKTLLFDDNVGVVNLLARLERKNYLSHVRSFLSRFRNEILCEECKGTGLDSRHLDFSLNGFSLADIFSVELDELGKSFIPSLEDLKTVSPEVEMVVSNLESKFKVLSDLKLGHLNLVRKLKTLSGGEYQRLCLASSLGNPLNGLQYILDEPSTGLHPKDNAYLGSTLIDLRNRGNTIILIEHDPYFLKISDYVIELGPNAGTNGGNVIFAGNPEKLDHNPFSAVVPNLKNSTNPTSYKFRTFEKLSRNNVVNQSISIKLNCLNVLCGVSGAGKTTLLNLIYEELQKASEKVLFADQKFTPKNSRSIVASYLGFWDDLRSLVGKLTNMPKKYFSFNSANEGRCGLCKGLGYLIEDLQFLPSVKIKCSECEGLRFNAIVLESRVRGLNIIDILNLTLEEFGKIFFELAHEVELPRLLGLSYLRLGQTLSEVSVGEAQRLKILRHLKTNLGDSFILFDEPTVGLHPKDFVEFVNLIDWLLANGNTVIISEHHPELIKLAHHIIEIGPRAGKLGGKVVYEGPPKRKHYHFENKSILQPSTRVARTYDYLDFLHVVKCGQRNLRIRDLKIPYKKLVAFTGVSGAGKSSLVFETIAAESQRFFLSHLSPYTLSFLDVLPKPTDSVLLNLKPTLSLEQYYAIRSESSSVGTLTDIFSYLRLLYAKLGEQLCPEHRMPLVRSDKNSLIDSIKSIKPPILICGSLIRGRKGSFKDLLATIRESEAVGVLIDEIFVSRDKIDNINIDKNRQHSIDVVTASITSGVIDDCFLTESINLSKKFGAKAIKILETATRKLHIFSLESQCPVCGRGAIPLDPEDLSFSSKRGRCDFCSGSGYLQSSVCDFCKGSGLNAIALSVLLNGKNIGEVSNLKLTDLTNFLENFFASRRDNPVALAIMEEVMPRINSLIELGLGYLSLSRRLSTLSSGELQRARLSSILNTKLKDIVLILDEPTASLHKIEVEMIVRKIKEQVKNGNSVFMIEHDLTAIKASDYVVELGPGGGKDGGRVVFEGSIEEFKNAKTNTSKFFSESLPQINQFRSPSSVFEVVFSCVNNLKIKNLRFPSNCIVGICGRSGSGKSSLAMGTIYPALNGVKSDKYQVIKPDSLDEAIFIDQNLISKNSRATPATYLGIWSEIRSVFALTPFAKAEGYTARDFSFNATTGRNRLFCKLCRGNGFQKIAVGFLREERITCPECGGCRFDARAEKITFKGFSIRSCLNLTFKEAFGLFSEIRSVSKVIQLVLDIGLGHLTLGQSLATLSGGENQRLKLIRNLLSKTSKRLLYILDEPTLGLHQSDVRKLALILRRLVDRGHSVIIVEHDESFLRSCDYIIELGPFSGDDGGLVIFSGPVQEYYSGLKYGSTKSAG